MWFNKALDNKHNDVNVLIIYDKFVIQYDTFRGQDIIWQSSGLMIKIWGKSSIFCWWHNNYSRYQYNGVRQAAAYWEVSHR